jgi:hypothetical protein
MTTEDLADADGATSATTASTAAPEQSEKVETPAKEQSSETTSEDGKQPDAANQDADAKAASEAGKALNRHKQTASERVQQAVARQREAERRAERAEARARELEGKLKPPVADDYTDQAKLTADQVKHSLAQQRIEDLRDEHKAAADEANAARAHAWAERVNDFKAEHADFEQVAFSAPIGRETSLMVADMEDGPAVAYYLGKNPALARQIEGLPDRQKPFALGKIAAQVTAPPPRRVTTAPGPVETTAGKSGGGAGFDPHKASPAEFSAQYRKQYKRD